MLTRRRFISFLGAGIATAATPAIVEPVRKLWFVPSSAPVGSRVDDIAWARSFAGRWQTAADMHNAGLIDAENARRVLEFHDNEIRHHIEDHLRAWDAYRQQPIFVHPETYRQLAEDAAALEFEAIAANPADQGVADLATRILNHDPAIRAAMAEARKQHQRDVEEALLYGRGPYAQELAPRIYSTGLSFESWDLLRTDPEQSAEVATRS